MKRNTVTIGFDEAKCAYKEKTLQHKRLFHNASPLFYISNDLSSNAR